MGLEVLVLLSVVGVLAVAGRESGGAPGPRANDAKDIAAVANGEQAALGRIYDRYGRLVFSLALRVLDERGAAEEVTQDVFVQLWRSASMFDPARGDLMGWLVSITRNRAIDRLRSKQQRASDAWVPLDDMPFLAAAPTSREFESAERVRKALALLPEQQRNVLELAYYQGYSQAEIAARLNLPLGTVKTWTRSALKALRGSLGTE
jgi:RNA polymerase sigma-70 factor, ECF subfamily